LQFRFHNLFQFSFQFIVTTRSAGTLFQNHSKNIDPCF
jgi:hypothetical protein